jgi:hypothetical protein
MSMDGSTSFTAGGQESDTRQQPTQPSSGGNLYFAYGSNLHVAQMAKRCPMSLFKGKATLAGYRWQINQRGVANIVESANNCVEGLLYWVSPKDERALNRSEGVSKGFYNRRFLELVLESHGLFLDRKSSEVAPLLAQAPNGVRQRVRALVYVSENYSEDGAIREEYISRMELATSDAVALGVSQSFVDQVIGPHLVRNKSI